MKKKYPTDYQDLIKESGISLDELHSTPNKIQKTTRTTFNLKKKTLEAMSLLCTNYGMKQREFIDDVVVPNSSFIVSNPKGLGIVSKIKDEIQSEDSERKTFVLSNTSLKKLNDLSNETGIHRDRLFTVAVSIAEIMLEDRNEKHQKASEILEELSRYIKDIEEKLTTLLSNDDPIPQRVGIVGMILDNLLGAISSELNEGTPIDPDDFSQER